jgi:hypothetical protein
MGPTEALFMLWDIAQNIFQKQVHNKTFLQEIGPTEALFMLWDIAQHIS